ncbi:hypothetical protein N7495_007156 [Penicillium taxi]|uniref:uncharacterized protein n=1 Tax=Penicillium taxi TaxID=168475 RepID=UPI0025458648|nr:uncharacterized protein N7495_007156 [Penicillium taxi]KAJ5895465.1 hypothetical protein N7495_007156 [Penicillium taxi]
MASLPENSRQASTDLQENFSAHSDYYIGIDVGTSSARACIMNAKGDIVGLAHQNIGLWQPEHGYYEQSTTDTWSSVCIAVQRAIHENNIGPDTVRGIGFDATCSLAVFNHETNEPVSVTGPNFDTDRNIILWLDHRPVDEAAKINFINHPLLRYVGGTISAEMEIPKVLWLKNHMPEKLFDKCSFYDLADALTHIATGGEKQRLCSEGIKHAYVPVGADGSVKGWDIDFLHGIGLAELAEDNFKRMGGVDKVNGDYLGAGELVGYLCEKAASDLGLPAGIPIGSGVIDAYAGWIGTVGAKANLSPNELNGDVPKNDKMQAFSRLAAVAGTSTCHLVMSPNPIFVNGVWGPYSDTIIPGYSMSEGGQSATGELLQHVINTHAAFDHVTTIAESHKSNIYEYLNHHLNKMMEEQQAPCIAYLARHFFFYGDLWGNRSPIADQSMTGSVIGLTSDKTINGLAIQYYATLEFIALQTKQIVDTMNHAGHKIKSIFMSGSQCQNEILVNLIASACDMPVIIPQYIHAAVCHGAAMLGAKAASADKHGKTEDLWAIMDRMSKPGKKVMPTVEVKEKALLKAKYQVFLEQCFRQQKYRQLVNEAVGDWVST